MKFLLKILSLFKGPTKLDAVRVGQLSFLECYQLRRLVLNDVSALHKWLKRATPTAGLILAKQGPLVVGWGTVGQPFSNLPRSHMLFVHPNYRKQGLGVQLLQRAETAFGAHPVVMWDLASAQFYHKAMQNDIITSAVLLKVCPDHEFLSKANSQEGVTWFLDQK